MENDIYQELKEIQKESVDTRIRVTSLDATVTSMIDQLKTILNNINQLFDEHKNLTAKHMQVVEDNIALKSDNNWFKSLATKVFVSLGSVATICLSAYLFLYHKIDDVDRAHQAEIVQIQQKLSIDEVNNNDEFVKKK